MQFSYDSSGNMTSDPLRGLIFAYNILNQPSGISPSSDDAWYTYLADGTKAMVESELNDAAYAYLGSMVFSFSTGGWAFDSTPFSGGRIRKSGSAFVTDRLCHWNTKDPLAEKYPAVSPYAYCAGDPVNFYDREGTLPHVVVGAIIGGVVNGGIALYQGKEGREVLGAVAGGAIYGAVTASTFGASILSAAAFKNSGHQLGASTKTIMNIAVNRRIEALAGADKAATDIISKATNTFLEQALGWGKDKLSEWVYESIKE